MQKTDLMEIKKTLKSKDKCTISQLCTCYVDNDKTIHTNYNCGSFLNLPDQDYYKYIDILKKFMSCKAGDTLFSVPFNNEDNKKALQTMRTSELRQSGVIEAFLSNFVKNYSDDNNYSIFLFYSAYDIPAKGKDKSKQDESDEVYTAIYGVVCPVEKSEPGLSYYENDQEFHNRDRDYIVGKPVIGFMYPDFDNREVNDNNIIYGICTPKAPHKEIPEKLFGSKSPSTAKDQAKLLNESLAEVFAEKETDKVTKITKNIMNKISEINTPEKGEETNEDADEKPKKPHIQTTIGIDEIKNAVVESGIDEDEAEKFIKTFKEKAPLSDGNIRINKVSKKSKVKIEDIDISLPTEKVDSVTTENRNGKKYVIIELSDDKSEMTINGIVCK